ncbi:hypothetical protein R1flu_006355 [Riccia fluitans]|uniref:Uncharacterized protein n=1 Tax=Riccia fluitans TaxID=41844 RepID=A0ABD1YVS7_9MARC
MLREQHRSSNRTGMKTTRSIAKQTHMASVNERQRRKRHPRSGIKAAAKKRVGRFTGDVHGQRADMEQADKIVDQRRSV